MSVLFFLFFIFLISYFSFSHERRKRHSFLNKIIDECLSGAFSWYTLYIYFQYEWYIVLPKLCTYQWLLQTGGWRGCSPHPLKSTKKNIWYWGHEGTFFVKEHSDSKTQVLWRWHNQDALVDNIFVVFALKVFQQTVGIPMGTHFAPLLLDIFLYLYEAGWGFIQSLLSTGKKQLASWFNLTYRNSDDVFSINNPEFDNYLPDVSFEFTWDQGHHREHHFCFLPWFTTVDWEG